MRVGCFFTDLPVVAQLAEPVEVVLALYVVVEEFSEDVTSVNVEYDQRLKHTTHSIIHISIHPDTKHKYTESRLYCIKG